MKQLEQAGSYKAMEHAVFIAGSPNGMLTVIRSEQIVEEKRCEVKIPVRKNSCNA